MDNGSLKGSASRALRWPEHGIPADGGSGARTIDELVPIGALHFANRSAVEAHRELIRAAVVTKLRHT